LPEFDPIRESKVRRTVSLRLLGPLESMERDPIVKNLIDFAGNKVKAAKSLACPAPPSTARSTNTASSPQQDSDLPVQPGQRTSGT
jgi:hypothetical protein